MVIEEVVNQSGVIGVINESLIGGVISEVGRIGLWMQTLGLIVVLWIIVQAVNLYFNRKKKQILYKMQDDMKELRLKIDKIEKSLRKK